MNLFIDRPVGPKIFCHVLEPYDFNKPHSQLSYDPIADLSAAATSKGVCLEYRRPPEPAVTFLDPITSGKLWDVIRAPQALDTCEMERIIMDGLANDKGLKLESPIVRPLGVTFDNLNEWTRVSVKVGSDFCLRLVNRINSIIRSNQKLHTRKNTNIPLYPALQIADIKNGGLDMKLIKEAFTDAVGQFAGSITVSDITSITYNPENNSMIQTTLDQWRDRPRNIIDFSDYWS